MLSAITNEYTELLSRKALILRELPKLPIGYISKKNIKGKEYCYLQTRVHGKITSTYLKTDEAKTAVYELNLRKKYESELPDIEKRISKIKNAVKLLDGSFARKLDMLELCVGMDEMSAAIKSKCLSFADAMTSIEGVPISDSAKNELDKWMNGTATFLSVFESTLKRYGFPVEYSK